MNFENVVYTTDFAHGINGTVGGNVTWGRVGVNKSESNRTRSGAYIFRGDQSLSSQDPSLVVNVSDASKLNNLTQMTLELWFNNNRTTSYSPSAHLISHVDDAVSFNGGGWQLTFGNAANTLTFTLFNEDPSLGLSVNSTVTANTTGATNGNWNYVVVTFNGTRMESALYVNGVKEGNDSTDSRSSSMGAIVATGIPTGPNGKALFVGGLPFMGSNIFNGSIDEIRIWNKSLTHNEILFMYNGSSGVYKHNSLPSTMLGDGGDNFTAIMTVSDGTNDSLSRISNNVQIASAGGGGPNNAPAVTQPTFDPTVIYTNSSNLTASTTYSDADSNKGNVTFVLFVNNIRQNESSVANIASAGIAAAAFGNNWNKTDNLTVQVNATDGTDTSAYLNSSINVSNVIPRPGTIAISPPSVSNTSTNFISFNTVNITDSDNGDKINVTITWFKNNIAIRNITKTDQANNTNVTDILAQGNYTGGDTLIVQYNVSEGGLQSHYVNSSSVTAGRNCVNINVAGVYTLDRNLNAFGSCFNRTVSNVELNCAGYYINYSVSSLGYGVNVSNAANVTIKNCAIGQNSTIVSNAHAFYLRNVTNGTIVNNSIETRSTSSHGVLFIESSGLFFSNLSNVVNNTFRIRGASAEGIRIEDAGYTRVFNNSIFTNGSESFGISVRSVSGSNPIGNTIANNTVIIAGSSGGSPPTSAILIGTNSNFIVNNTVKAFAGSRGISTSNSDTIITYNNVTTVASIGINVGGKSNVTNNTVWTNGTSGDGIFIGSN